VSAYGISEVAERTGIPATTLRYYEDIGIVPPPRRTNAGYRVYDDRTLARLSFIANAKRLGLTLDEVGSLVRLWDADECAPVQEEMGRLVDAKISELARRSGELVAFANELQLIAARLRSEAHPGPCDDSCACASVGSAAAAPSPVAFVVKAVNGHEPAIGCTLTDSQGVARRVEEWQRLLSSLESRQTIDNSILLRFPPGSEVAAEVARLSSAEAECCSWIDFTIRVTAEATVLEVRAPPAGQAILASMFSSIP
jgi:DNA-binding transcriptional MerR regulator